MDFWDMVLDPTFLVTFGALIAGGGVAVGRAEMKLRGIGKGLSDTIDAVESLKKKLALEVSSLQAEKSDRSECVARHEHLAEIKRTQEDAIKRMLELGEKRMTQIEGWSRQTAEAVARLEGKVNMINGRKGGG